MKFSELETGKEYQFLEAIGKDGDGAPVTRNLSGKVIEIYPRSVLTEIVTKGGRIYRKCFNRMDTLNFEPEWFMFSKPKKKEMTKEKAMRIEAGINLNDLIYFLPNPETWKKKDAIALLERVETGRGNRLEIQKHRNAVIKYKRFRTDNGTEFQRNLSILKNMTDLIRGKK